MKNLTIIALGGAMVLIAGAPALAGGVTSGVRNDYTRSTSIENIYDGHRDIKVSINSYDEYQGNTESYKEFNDEVISLDGISGSYDGHTYLKEFENPVIQVSTSSGWTSASVTGSGWTETETKVNIQEYYTGESTSQSNGHEASSFAGSF